MLSIQQPIDLVSIALHNVLSYRKDEEYYNLVNGWNKIIIINITDLYPVTVIFQGNEVKFEMGETKKAHLKVSMSANNMIDIAFGRKGAIIAVLTRKIKIKGMLKVGVLLKFMKIFLKSMKLTAQEPNTNYFELEKETR